MGCGCGGSKATGGTFVHIAPDGKETVKRTEVEVRAMVIRYGGSWQKR